MASALPPAEQQLDSARRSTRRSPAWAAAGEDPFALVPRHHQAAPRLGGPAGILRPLPARPDRAAVRARRRLCPTSLSSMRALVYDDVHERILDAGEWQAALQGYSRASALPMPCSAACSTRSRKAATATTTMILLWTDPRLSSRRQGRLAQVHLREEACRASFRHRPAGRGRRRAAGVAAGRAGRHDADGARSARDRCAPRGPVGPLAARVHR